MPVISSKPYIAGDVIFKFKPLISCVKHEYKGKHCDNCLKPMDQLKRCAKCLQMYYCGRNCQTIDWSFHKNECKVFREKTIDGFHPIFIPLLRLFLRIKSDKTFATERHTLFDGSDVCLNDMTANSNIDGISAEHELIFNALCQRFKSFAIDFDVKDLFRWFGFVCEISHYLCHNSDNPFNFEISIGIGICLQLWPISHSCLPNTAFVRKDEWIEIRAMKSIAVGDEITMALIALYMNGVERREQLKMFGSVCSCDKCRLHLDKDMDYQEFTRLLGQQENHFDRLTLTLHPLLTYEMNSNLMLYLEAIYGEFHPAVTVFLLKAFICFANSMKSSDSLLRLWFKRIERHVLVTHGSDHPWYPMLCNIFADSLLLL